MAVSSILSSSGICAFIFASILPACAPSIGSYEGLEEEKADIVEPEEPVDDWCADPNSCGETFSLVTAAPQGLGEAHLGRPVSLDFSLMTGPGSASLFPESAAFSTDVYSVEHKYTFIENSLSLNANFKGWGVQANAGTNSARRYGAFRAQRLNHVLEVDDTEGMRTPPEDAYFYVARIFYGHSYEAVVHGESKDFHVDVRANFAVASGGINVFAANNRLSVEVHARGLEPKTGSALFSRTIDDIEANYETGEEVPILVEYRSIPRRNISDDDVQSYEWTAPTKVRVSLNQIRVIKDGTLGGATWRFNAECKLNGTKIYLDDPVVWASQSGIHNNTTYPLYWSTELTTTPGDRVECGIRGTANNKDQIGFAQFGYDVKDNNAPVSGTFGSNSGGTEYKMYYSLDFPTAQ